MASLLNLGYTVSITQSKPFFNEDSNLKSIKKSVISGNKSNVLVYFLSSVEMIWDTFKI